VPVALFDHIVNTMGCQTRGSTIITVILAPCRPTRAVRLDVADVVEVLAGVSKVKVHIPSNTTN
jgi:hypothetical protein